jgi:S1-C subfamily serine protease
MNCIIRRIVAVSMAFALASAGALSQAGAGHAQSARGLTTAEVVRQASRSIVRIEVEGPTTETITEGSGPDAKTRQVDGYGVAFGTGFVIDDAGHVVTNEHVIHAIGISWKGEPRLTVELPREFNPRPDASRDKEEEGAYAKIVVRNDRSYLVNPPVVGYDEQSDLAVLQIRAGLLPPLKFARPESIEVGEDVVAIGFALGLQGKPTVTKGIISAVGRSYFEAPGAPGGRFLEGGDLIQTDAAINHGNSGGPLLNMAGEVVGVNTYTLAAQPNHETQGIYLARSCRTAARYVEELIADGAVARGRLGGALIEPPLFVYRFLDSPQGVLLMNVEPGSAAELAGLHRGDLILRLGGCDVRSLGDLDDALALFKTGRTVEVEFRDYEYTIKSQDSSLQPPKDAAEIVARLQWAWLSAAEKDAAPKTAKLVLN